MSLAALQIAVRLRGVLERVPLANGDVDATPGASNNSCARHENSSYVRLKLVRSGRVRYSDPAALRRRGSIGGTGPLAAPKSMRRTPPAPACTSTVSPGLTPVRYLHRRHAVTDRRDAAYLTTGDGRQLVRVHP